MNLRQAPDSRYLAQAVVLQCSGNDVSGHYFNRYILPLIGESLGLETKSTETLGLVPVSYKILEVVSSRLG